MKKGRPILIANWKMSLDREAAARMIEELEAGITDEVASRVEIVLCPSFVSLGEFGMKWPEKFGAGADGLAGGEVEAARRKFRLGAQDIFWEKRGAYTGAVSVGMIRGLAEYVLIGHSERRKYFGETDDDAARKTKAAIGAGLVPVVLIGESLVLRKKGQTQMHLEKQIEKILGGVSLGKDGRIVVAYEPIWAVGPETPAAEPEQVAEAVKIIRAKVEQVLGGDSERVVIIYGGSTDAGNILKFYDISEIGGAVVGHASLDAKEFSEMARKLAFY